MCKYSIIQAVNELFDVEWSTGKVPADWKEGIFVLLYKGKGSRCVCTKYRPISLLSVSGKVGLFVSVFLALLQSPQSRNQRLQQSGLTPVPSTIEASAGSTSTITVASHLQQTTACGLY